MLASSLVKGYVMLLCTAFLWGTAFIFQKSGAAHLDTFTFNFLRFGTAIPALLVLYLLPKQLFSPNETARRQRQYSALFIGCGAGVFMFLGISLQQWGLTYTTTGKSGFLTALYIIFVPIFALFLRQRCRLEVWVGALLTLLGVYLLGSHDTGNAQSDFNFGDVLTILCAFAWAAQVLWLGFFARYANVLNIAVLQVVVVALLSGVVMLFTKGLPSWELVWQVRYDILYTGVVSSAVAFTLQILGQRDVPATNAALIMSCEAVFAMLGGVVILGETVTWAGVLGCGCILLGIILAQLQGKVFLKK